MKLMTHRGIDNGRGGWYEESSLEAFEGHLREGHSLEVDINFCEDGVVVMHDGDMGRVSVGRDKRALREMSVKEWKRVMGEYGKGTWGRLEEVLELMKGIGDGPHGLHLKGKYQDRERMGRLVEVMKGYQAMWEKVFIFDVKREVVGYLRGEMSGVELGVSLAHEYDVERYNGCVGGTLYEVEGALEWMEKEGVRWGWLDEWDLVGRDGGRKEFYEVGMIRRLRQRGIKVALVSPELHALSPGLLGGEAHEDGGEFERVERRLRRFVEGDEVDAICTDFGWKMGVMGSKVS